MQNEVARPLLAMHMTSAGFEDKRIVDILAEQLEHSNIVSEPSRQSERSRRWLAGGLLKYDSANLKAISTLLDLLKHSKSPNTCRWVAQDLGEASNRNYLLTETLLCLLLDTKEPEVSYAIALGLQEAFDPTVLKTIVGRLRGILNEEIHESNFSLYEDSFALLWHCSYRMSYLEFYKIWHS